MITRFSSLGPFRYSDAMDPLAVKTVASIGVTLVLLTASPLCAQEVSDLNQEQRLEVETLLGKLGFDPGKVDGIIDEDSRFAIRAYQDFAALTPDGKADQQLLRELRSVAAILADLPAEEVPEAAVDEPKEPESAVAEKPPAPELSAESEAAEPAASAAQSGADAAAKGGDLKEIPDEAAEVPSVPPVKKPEPPPAKEPTVTKAQEPESKSGFDLGGLLSKLSTSGATSGAADAAADDPAARQQALLQAQNRELFAQAYGAGKSRQYGRAIGSYEDLTERPGLSTEEKAVVYFNLGNLWLELANNLRALESYDSALELTPEFREAHNNRGLVLKRLGQEREAEKAIAEAKRLGLAWDGQPKVSFQSLALSAGI
jgi:tetratricopeptide (TPR) repeat protein